MLPLLHKPPAAPPCTMPFSQDELFKLLLLTLAQTIEVSCVKTSNEFAEEMSTGNVYGIAQRSIWFEGPITALTHKFCKKTNSRGGSYDIGYKSWLDKLARLVHAIFALADKYKDSSRAGCVEQFLREHSRLFNCVKNRYEKINGHQEHTNSGSNIFGHVLSVPFPSELQPMMEKVKMLQEASKDANMCDWLYGPNHMLDDLKKAIDFIIYGLPLVVRITYDRLRKIDRDMHPEVDLTKGHAAAAADALRNAWKKAKAEAKAKRLAAKAEAEAEAAEAKRIQDKIDRGEHPPPPPIQNEDNFPSLGGGAAKPATAASVAPVWPALAKPATAPTTDEVEPTAKSTTNKAKSNHSRKHPRKCKCRGCKKNNRKINPFANNVSYRGTAVQ